MKLQIINIIINIIVQIKKLKTQRNYFHSSERIFNTNVFNNLIKKIIKEVIGFILQNHIQIIKIILIIIIYLKVQI